MKTLLFLSPHLDDAILSCGGWMAEAAANGSRVVVYNLFCKPYKGPLSPLAQEVHDTWGNYEYVTALRLEEDRRAMEIIGVEAVMGDVHDLIYRQDQAGDWLYTCMEDIQGERRSEDDALVAHYFNKVKTMVDREAAVISAPLGIGVHIDHLLVFEVGMKLHQAGYEVEFYEDIPYAMNVQRLETRIRRLEKMAVSVKLFSLVNLDKKIEALKFYKSQLPGLFGNDEKMVNEITQYALDVSGREDMGGERIWQMA